jgi:hypothetical protein
MYKTDKNTTRRGGIAGLRQDLGTFLLFHITSLLPNKPYANTDSRHP